MAVGPLFVKVIAAPAVPGHNALALCTEDGELVGRQVGCTIENNVDEIATITVRFLVDGDKVRFASNDD